MIVLRTFSPTCGLSREVQDMSSQEQSALEKLGQQIHTDNLSVLICGSKDPLIILLQEQEIYC